MRVLVTGGAGFIGSHLVRRLVKAEDEVVALDKPDPTPGIARTSPGSPTSLHQGDIADHRAVEQAATGCEAIVNFAAETHVDRSIIGPAEFIVDRRPRHPGAARPLPPGGDPRSSRSRPTRCTAIVPVGDPGCTEEFSIRPSSPYSASKTGGDLQVLAYIRTYDVDACITRGANNYGPRQYPEKFLPLFITNAFDGESLPVYGDGRQRREWLHADDYCAAIELVMRKAPSGEIYNVGGQECENMDVVRKILDLTGASPDLVRHVEDRPGHDRRYAVGAPRRR